MQTYAIVNAANSTVENTILWDGLPGWSPPEGFIAVQSDSAAIGWKFEGGEFTAPGKEDPHDL